MQAITAAANYLGGKYLKVAPCMLLEPCRCVLEPCIESDFKNVLGQAMKVAVFKWVPTPSKTVVKRGVLAELQT
jgi:hypothetical protein